MADRLSEERLQEIAEADLAVVSPGAGRAMALELLALRSRVAEVERERDMAQGLSEGYAEIMAKAEQAEARVAALREALWSVIYTYHAGESTVVLDAARAVLEGK